MEPCWAKHPNTAWATTLPTATTVSSTPNAAPREGLDDVADQRQQQRGQARVGYGYEANAERAGTVVAPNARGRKARDGRDRREEDRRGRGRALGRTPTRRPAPRVPKRAALRKRRTPAFSTS